MPAACGNLSIVRTAWPAVAMHHAKPKAVAPVVAQAPPAAEPAPVDDVAAIPDDTPVAAPVAVANTEFPPVPAAAAHHSLLPLLAPLLLGPLLLPCGCE